MMLKKQAASNFAFPKVSTEQSFNLSSFSITDCRFRFSLTRTATAGYHGGVGGAPRGVSEAMVISASGALLFAPSKLSVEVRTRTLAPMAWPAGKTHASDLPDQRTAQHEHCRIQP
jgi:hypothetical protein